MKNAMTGIPWVMMAAVPPAKRRNNATKEKRRCQRTATITAIPAIGDAVRKTTNGNATTISITTGTVSLIAQTQTAKRIPLVGL